MLIQSTSINIVDTIQWFNNVTTLWFYVEYEIKVRADKMHGWFKIPSPMNSVSLFFHLLSLSKSVVVVQRNRDT